MEGSFNFENAVASFVSFNEVLAAFDNFIEDTAIAMRPSPSSNSWPLAYLFAIILKGICVVDRRKSGCDKWKESILQ